mmetsp:Transcript_25019/g.25470  ORF Transcript_25019/g.25470 Transcript_25019/m.25470 type:complete len:154 (+) Transcript_25019:235-696(+)
MSRHFEYSYLLSSIYSLMMIVSTIIEGYSDFSPSEGEFSHSANSLNSADTNATASEVDGTNLALPSSSDSEIMLLLSVCAFFFKSSSFLWKNWSTSSTSTFSIISTISKTDFLFFPIFNYVNYICNSRVNIAFVMTDHFSQSLLVDVKIIKSI